MWNCINLLSGLVTGCASRFRHILAWLTKGPRQHPSSNVEDPGGQGDIEDPTFGEIASYLVLNAVSSCETDRYVGKRSKATFEEGPVLAQSGRSCPTASRGR
jgi:hypothetical protein